MRLCAAKISTILMRHCTSRHRHSRIYTFWTRKIQFLYRTSERMAPAPYCQKYACMIQDCLDRHRQDQSKCQNEINLIIACCDKLTQLGKKSVCCGENIRARFPTVADSVPAAQLQRQVPKDAQ